MEREGDNKINHRNAITKHPKTQSETINRTSRVCRLYFRYIYTIQKFVPVSVALSVYVCVYVRLTSVTDKSKRQHFGLFFSLFLTKNRKLAGAQSAPALNWHWSGSVIGLYCCCCCCCLSVCCLLFFLYFYFIDIGRYFFFFNWTKPTKPTSIYLSCLPAFHFLQLAF